MCTREHHSRKKAAHESSDKSAALNNETLMVLLSALIFGLQSRATWPVAIAKISNCLGALCLQGCRSKSTRPIVLLFGLFWLSCLATPGIPTRVGLLESVFKKGTQCWKVRSNGTSHAQALGAISDDEATSNVETNRSLLQPLPI